MIQEYINRFIDKEKNTKEELLNNIEKIDEFEYLDFCKLAISLISHRVDDPQPSTVQAMGIGSYQGDYVFFMTNGGYSSNKLWITSCAYGSCSGCDTIENIHTYDTVTERVDAYFQVMLNLIQRLKEVDY